MPAPNPATDSHWISVAFIFSTQAGPEHPDYEISLCNLSSSQHELYGTIPLHLGNADLNIYFLQRLLLRCVRGYKDKEHTPPALRPVSQYIQMGF